MHLSKPLEEWTQEQLIAELRFLGGIVEQGEGRNLKEGEAISEAVLNYVRRLEQGDPHQSIYQQAIDTWGQAPQTMMAIGECGEFIAATNQWMNQGKAGPMAVITEVADVMIMMEQMRLILGPSLVDSEKVRKISRLRGILDGRVAHPHHPQHNQKVCTL